MTSMNRLKNYNCLESPLQIEANVSILLKDELSIDKINKGLEHVEKGKETLRNEIIGLLEDNFIQVSGREKQLSY